MPCRDSERVTKKKEANVTFQMCGDRQLRVRERESPAGGSAVTHAGRSVNPNHPGQKQTRMTSVSVHLPEPFYTPTTTATTTTISHHLLLFSNSYWTFALQKVFLKKTTTQRQKTKTKKETRRFHLRYQNTELLFVKS